MTGLKHFRLDWYPEGWVAISRNGIGIIPLDTDDFDTAYDFLNRPILDVLKDIALTQTDEVKRGRKVLDSLFIGHFVTQEHKS